MPNLWNKATQFFDEAFNGPRTKDVEFDLLTEEILEIETGVMALKQILENFLDYSLNFKRLLHDISQSIPKIYSNTSPFHVLGKAITDSHCQMEQLFDSYSINVTRLIKKTTEWSVLFTQAKRQIAKREENRKVYDHYDEKLERIFKKKRDKGKESGKESQRQTRNIEKYKRATEAYVKSSDESYAIISEVLNKRYEMINPVLLEFLNEERKFFLSVGRISSSLEDIDVKFRSVKRSIPDDLVTEYDPCLYIRGGLLIKRDNIKKNNHKESKDKEELEMISTEEAFERTVSQCKIETRLLRRNEKEEEVAVIAKKASLRAEPCKKKSFAAIPDQFTKKGDSKGQQENGMAKDAFVPQLITKDKQGLSEPKDIFSDLF